RVGGGQRIRRRGRAVGGGARIHLRGGEEAGHAIGAFHAILEVQPFDATGNLVLGTAGVADTAVDPAHQRTGVWRGAVVVDAHQLHVVGDGLEVAGEVKQFRRRRRLLHRGLAMVVRGVWTDDAARIVGGEYLRVGAVGQHGEVATLEVAGRRFAEGGVGVQSDAAQHIPAAGDAAATRTDRPAARRVDVAHGEHSGAGHAITERGAHRRYGGEGRIRIDGRAGRGRAVVAAHREEGGEGVFAARIGRIAVAAATAAHRRGDVVH